MKRTSALLLSLLVIANVAVIAPAQATPWETFKNGAVQTGTFIKKGVSSVATAIKNNIVSPSKIVLGTIGTCIGTTEAVAGSTLLAISTIIKPSTIRDALVATGQPFLIENAVEISKVSPILKNTGIIFLAVSIPTILLSLQSVKNGVQELQNANNAAQHD